MSSMIGFDYTKHDIPEDDFPEEEVLPKGEYVAVCIDITEGQSQSGNEYVKYVWQIQEGPHSGKKISNFENPSTNDEERHKWYMKRLKSLMTICGIQVIERLDQLQMIPVIISNKPYQGSNGGWFNSINYYKRFGSSQTRNTATAPVQNAAPVQRAAPPVAQVAPAQAAVPTPQPQPVMATPQVAPQVAAGNGYPPQMAPSPVPAPQPVPPPQQAVPLQQAMAQANATYEDVDPPF